MKEKRKEHIILVGFDPTTSPLTGQQTISSATNTALVKWESFIITRFFTLLSTIFLHFVLTEFKSKLNILRDIEAAV